jgi:outer membrane receptor protein involved in Fe transport
MNQKKFFIWTMLIGMSLITASSLFAGVTGKIAGRIVDKKDGSPIPGANIIVVGTLLGAVSDINGNYVILQVPPGIYSLRATMLGFTSIVVEDLDVRIDQTSNVDFTLQTEVIEGETVTVVADRKVVKPDVSTSMTSVASADLTALPVSNVTGVVGMQAGVQGLNIRGSLEGATLFMVDGITMRDPRNNQPISSVPLNAVEAVSIERGGFNAEYGQVQSGVVNVVTREGSKNKYQGSVEFKYSAPHAKYFGISPYDANSYWLRPYLDPEVCWTGTTSWDKYTQRQYPSFEGWNSVSQTKMTNSNQNDDLSPVGAQTVFAWEHRKKPVTNQPDYDIDAGFGGLVPVIGEQLGNLRFYASYRRHREMLLVPLSRDDYVDDDLMVQMVSDISPSMKLRFTTMMGAQYTMLDNWTYGYTIRNPDQVVNRIAGLTGEGLFSSGWFSLDDISYKSFSGKLTNTVSAKSYYDVSLEHLARKYYARPTAALDTTKNNEIFTGYFVDNAPFGYTDNLGEKGINSMPEGGHMCRYTDQTRVGVTTLKANYTSQVSPEHLMKTGLEFYYYNIDLLYYQLTTRTQRSDNPILGAWYIQDKMEAKGFIVNAGLRVDYSNANTNWYNIDPYNYSFISSKYDTSATYPTQKTKGQLNISPRLGISHPVTENSKLFFNYGHFMQQPSYDNVFQVTRTSTGQLTQFGNPDLTLAKTISYELGYDHSLFNDQLLIQLAAFYKDISDQAIAVTYNAISGIAYTQNASTGYGDIRGFELTLRKPRGKWWNGFGNFTYQTNKNGQFDRAQVYQDQSQQAKYDRATSNLYQNRPIPQPYARVNVSFFTPSDFGPKVAGFSPLSDWLLNVSANWQKGGYTTWNPNQIAAISYNVRTTDMYDLTLRISKKFTLNKLDFYMFADIGNVLNTKFLSYYGTINSFADYNDQQYYMNSLHLPKNPAYSNIIGNDKYGDYRKDGVDYQPIEQVGILNTETLTGDKGVIYYDGATGRYMEYANQQWSQVDKNRMDKILKDKAYIDMPNLSSFWFLNPRRIFFGVRVTVNL